MAERPVYVVTKLSAAIFAQPGRSRGAVYAQARMFCAIQTVTTRERMFWKVRRASAAFVVRNARYNKPGRRVVDLVLELRRKKLYAKHSWTVSQ